MSGQWCVDVELEPLELEPLDELPPEVPDDEDVVLVAVVVLDVLDVLDVVAPWDDGVELEVAPDTSMPAPKLNPRAPATTPAATIG